MANKNTLGLMEQLGLSQDPVALARRAVEQRLASGGGGGGAFAQAFNVGRQLGNQGSGAVRGMLGGLGGVLQDPTDVGAFGSGFTQAVQDNNYRVASEELGMPVAQIKARQKTQAQAQNVNVPDTGNPIADQAEALKQIINIANANGDSDTALKAMQRLTQLQAEQEAFDQAQLGTRAGQRQEQREVETDSAGRTVMLPGDDLAGPVSKARMNEDGTWTVVRPNGSVREGVDGIELIFVDPKAAASAAQRAANVRQWETPEGQMKAALDLNKVGNSQMASARNGLMDMSTQANVVGEMTDTLVDMYNPEIAFSDSARVARGADRLFTFGNTLTKVFARQGEDAHQATREEYRNLTNSDQLTQFLAAQGKDMKDILPEHIQADTKEAALFAANVMQLAYLDARIQEPSNRGLSDNDIQNALTRIGVGSPNPLVFAERQRQIVNRAQGKLRNLGMELAGTTQISKRDVIDHIYQPDLVNSVSSVLAETEEKLTGFIDSQTPQEGAVDITTMSLEDLEALERQLSEGQQ